MRFFVLFGDGAAGARFGAAEKRFGRERPWPFSRPDPGPPDGA